MEIPHEQHYQESQLYSRLPQKKHQALPIKLQEECVYLTHRLKAGVRPWSIVWDPYWQGDIDKLERVQRSAARLITKDYISRQDGCVTAMLKGPDLDPLQERRRHQRSTFLYKVVKGHVPAINLEHYLKPLRPKRTIRARQYENFIYKNIIDNSVNNNTKCFQPLQSNSDSYKTSYFVKTVLDWNKLSASQWSTQDR